MAASVPNHHHSANGNNSTSANAAAAAAAAADGTFDGTARLLCSVSALTATRQQQHQHYMCKCPHHCQHVHHHHHHQQDHQNDDDVRGNAAAAAAAVEAAVDQTQASESCCCLETASERRESEGERHIKIFKLPLFKSSVSKQCFLENAAPGESKHSLASATVSTGSQASFTWLSGFAA